MLLTDPQKTALTELIQLALSQRTTTDLTQLLGSAVHLQVTQVSLYPLSYLSNQFALSQQLICVHQGFKGQVSGDALWILDYSLAILLAQELHPDWSSPIPHFNLSVCEEFTEIGNSFLNAYLEMLGTLAERNLASSVPSFQINSPAELAEGLIASKTEVRYALISEIAFIFNQHEFKNYLLCAASAIALSCLIRGVNTVMKEKNSPDTLSLLDS